MVRGTESVKVLASSRTCVPSFREEPLIQGIAPGASEEEHQKRQEKVKCQLPAISRNLEPMSRGGPRNLPPGRRFCWDELGFH